MALSLSVDRLAVRCYVVYYTIVIASWHLLVLAIFLAVPQSTGCINLLKIIHSQSVNTLLCI